MKRRDWECDRIGMVWLIGDLQYYGRKSSPRVEREVVRERREKGDEITPLDKSISVSPVLASINSSRRSLKSRKS